MMATNQGSASVVVARHVRKAVVVDPSSGSAGRAMGRAVVSGTVRVIRVRGDRAAAIVPATPVGRAATDLAKVRAAAADASAGGNVCPTSRASMA